MKQGLQKVLVAGLSDGATGGAGRAILACLDSDRWWRIGAVASEHESGAYGEGCVEELEVYTRAGRRSLRAELRRIALRHEPCAVLAGDGDIALLLAAFDPAAAMDACRDEGLSVLPLQPLPAGFGPASFGAIFPCLLTTTKERRLAVDGWDAFRAASALAKDGQQVAFGPFDPQGRFEVAVVAEDGQCLASACVRVLADDARLRPWAVVSVDSPALLQAVLRVCESARIEGPATLHFQRLASRFLFSGAGPGLPTWIEITRGASPNLVELAALQSLGEALHPEGNLPAGLLLTQTCEDLVVHPDDPVRSAIQAASKP